MAVAMRNRNAYGALFPVNRVTKVDGPQMRREEHLSVPRSRRHARFCHPGQWGGMNVYVDKRQTGTGRRRARLDCRLDWTCTRPTWINAARKHGPHGKWHGKTEELSFRIRLCPIPVCKKTIKWN